MKLFLVTVLLALVALIVGLYTMYHSPKIAYVRSYDLVQKYLGTKEAMENLDKKNEKWKSNMDTLSYTLQKSIAQFNNEIGSLSASRKMEKEQMLNEQREQLENYYSVIEQKAQEEHDKIMQTVLNQVNTYIEEYGQANGYDVILGTTASGSVLYGEKRLDVTEDVLRGLNEKFQGRVTK